MTRTLLTLALLGAALSGDARAATFQPASLLPQAGVDVLDRTVARDRLSRELFGDPWATAVIGRVDVYDRFPYLESRWFQVVSDAAWDRLLVGELDGHLAAWDGAGAALGRLDEPRGLDVDPSGRLYVADSGNRRILALDVVTEYDRIALVPRFAIEGLARPYDVAHSDAGTPFDPSDDRLYVVDAGASRVLRYDLAGDGAVLRASLGELGSGPGRFAGPLAIAVGRADGACTDVVYVADSHNRRIVALADQGDALQWRSEAPFEGDGATSIDVDHFGHVYSSSPASGIAKMTADLEPLARLDAGVVRPRAFHVPFVNTTDHRTGEVRRAGQGAGIVVEEWGDATGLRLLRLGVDVVEPSVRAARDVSAGFTLTDRAAVTASVVDAAGVVLSTTALGDLPAGRNDVALAGEALAMPAGEYTLRLNARSSYEGSEGAQAELPFAWDGPAVAPASLAVLGARPNPFAGTTSIRFAIPARGAASHSLAIYDLAGRLVQRLSSGARSAGTHAATWNGRDASGRVVAAGVYLARLEADGQVAVSKVVHLR
jgi:hypothetical protein